MSKQYYQPFRAGDRNCGTSAALIKGYHVYEEEEVARFRHPDCRIVVYDEDDIEKPVVLPPGPSWCSDKPYIPQGNQRLITPEDVCPDGVNLHEPDWMGMNVERDGGEVYLNVPCAHCGLMGVVAEFDLEDLDPAW